MTIAELKEIIKDYPDDNFVRIRIWLKPDKDYLDDEVIQVTVEKYKFGIDGGLLLIGTDK